MEATVLVQSIAGLALILAVLVFILLKPKAKKVTPVNIKPSDKPKDNTSLEALRHVIRNRESSQEELARAVDMILKYHGNIPGKLGLRVNPGFDAYMEIFVSLCRHRNANKNMIIKLDKELVKNNPEYKSEINDAITKGLNSRR